MSAGALQPAINALYQDKHTVVVTESRWFKTLRDSVRYADAHPNVERYFYGPLTKILSTYADTCGDENSEVTLFVTPQGCFEAMMTVGPFSTDVRRQSPDLIFTVLKDTLNAENMGYGKAMLPGWLEAKPPKEESDVGTTGVPLDDTIMTHRLSIRLSRDLVQLCKQAYFAFHHFSEDIVHAIITYGMRFFCFRFTRPADWGRIRGDENGSVGSPEIVFSDEQILLEDGINKRFLCALHLMTGPLHLSFQPSWFQLPPDYSDPAPDLNVAKKALKLFNAPVLTPGPSPEQQEKEQDGNESYVQSSANSTDTVGLQLTGPTASRKPSQRGRTRHASPDDSPLLNRGKLKSKRQNGRTRRGTRAASPVEDPGPDSDHRDGYITLHIPVRSRISAGTLSGPDRIVKRMRNRDGVLPPVDQDSKDAADEAQKDKSGARKSRKRGRSDDADGANDGGQVQRKTGRQKRPRIAHQSAADNGHASTSRTQDEGPAAAISLGHANIGHAEPATAPSEDAQEPAEPSDSHPVAGTQSGTQQSEAAAAAQVADRGGVVLRRSTRNKKAR